MFAQKAGNESRLISKNNLKYFMIAFPLLKSAEEFSSTKHIPHYSHNPPDL